MLSDGKIFCFQIFAIDVVFFMKDTQRKNRTRNKAQDMLEHTENG